MYCITWVTGNIVAFECGHEPLHIMLCISLSTHVSPHAYYPGIHIIGVV